MVTGKINTKKKDNIGRLKFEGKLVNDHKEIAGIFKKHFISVAENIVTKNNHNDSSINNMDNTTLIHYLLQSFKFKLLSTRKIKTIIKSLKIKNYHGYAELSTKLLKIRSPFIVSPLTHICSKSLSSGIFPDSLKYSEIKPLFKKGDKKKISNYRSISIITSFSKVLEKAVHIQLYEQRSKNNILPNEPFGFRNKSATNNAMCKLINEILTALNNKLMVGGIFYDLEKTFECTNHKILLSKLEFCGLKGKAKLWFESYFSNRYQRVLITNNVLNRNYFSTQEEIKLGVPQGSILDPLLFLFYVNDLLKAINDKSIPILFADDTSLLFTSPNKNDFQLNITTGFNLIN